jgi:hypothetical protein
MLTSNIITEESRFVVELTKELDDKQIIVRTAINKVGAAATIKKKTLALSKKISKNEKDLAELQQLLEYQVLERDTLKSIII